MLSYVSTGVAFIKSKFGRNTGPVKKIEYALKIFETTCAEHSEISESNQWKDTLANVKEMLDRKRISVQMLGMHNAGKSTLINALLSARVMPTGSLEKDDRTSLSVTLKHNDGLKDFKLQTDQQTIADGSKNIREQLQVANQSARSSKMRSNCTFCVTANLPVLSAVPDNWEAVLVDNPGFLDTDEQVKMIPEAAIMCSSVVVMVISCDNLSMDVTMSAYKKIKERDPSILAQNRLIVVGTKFDRNDDGGDFEKIVARRKEILLQDVNKAMDEHICEQNVFTVSGKWALEARECIEGHIKASSKVEMSLTSSGLHAVGQDGPTGLKGMLAAKTLEQDSGILQLEKRIKEVIRSSPHVWLDIARNDCMMLLEVAKSKLNEKMSKMEDDRCNHERELKALLAKRTSVDDKLDQLSDLMREGSEVYSALEGAYERDIEGREDMAREEVMKEVMNQLPSLEGFVQEKRTQLYEEREELEKFINEKVFKPGFRVLEETSFSDLERVLEDKVESLGKAEENIISETKELYDDPQHIPVSTNERKKQKATRLCDELRKVLNLEELIRELKLPEPQILCASKYYRRATLNQICNDLKEMVHERSETYLNEVHIKNSIIGYYFARYRRRVNTFLEEYKREWKLTRDLNIQKREADLRKMTSRVDKLKHDFDRLDEHKNKLKKLQWSAETAPESQQREPTTEPISMSCPEGDPKNTMN